MTINEAQQEMHQAYFGGGPGVFVSGLIWLIAGAVALTVSVQAGMIALFFGGMGIHPLGMAFSKWLGRSGKHNSDNPLGTLALETTFLLFIGIFLAFATSQLRAEWFFPVMLMVIGGRYLMFQTMYGMRVYWIFGGVLAIVGGVSLVFELSAPIVAFSGGVIEIVFAAVIVNLAKKRQPAATQS